MDLVLSLWLHWLLAFHCYIIFSQLFFLPKNCNESQSSVILSTWNGCVGFTRTNLTPPPPSLYRHLPTLPWCWIDICVLHCLRISPVFERHWISQRLRTVVLIPDTQYPQKFKKRKEREKICHNIFCCVSCVTWLITPTATATDIARNIKKKLSIEIYWTENERAFSKRRFKSFKTFKTPFCDAYRSPENEKILLCPHSPWIGRWYPTPHSKCFSVV